MSDDTPQERLESTARRCVERVEEAQDADDEIETLEHERAAIEDFADAAASLVAEGLAKHQLNPYLDAIADSEVNFTKTDLKEAVNSRVDDAERETADAPALDTFIDNRLETIQVVRTTDKKADPVWRWHFDTFEIETGSTKDGIEHFSWRQIRDEIYRASGELPLPPQPSLQDGAAWKDWIRSIIDARGNESETRGPRTVTVQSLQDFVRRSIAYAELADAVEHGGIRIDDDPFAGSPTELWIPNRHIKRICDEAEITPRSLQVELDARNHLVERVCGAAESEYVSLNGYSKKITYWVLNADFAAPQEYEETPKSAATLRDDDDDQTSAEPAPDEDDDPGLIGQVSGDSGGDLA